MALPVMGVVKPKVLSTVKNGEIPTSQLTTVPGGGKLVHPAARAWLALVDAFHKGTGLHLDYTARSTGGMYRSLTRQVQMLHERAVPNVRPAGSTWSRTWNGQRWYGKPGTAPVASPGTSNHGWGLAVDTALGNGTFTGSVTGINTKALDWLVANAHRFGWSWESQVEPWHIRYVAGDNIPAAVLAFERGSPPPPPPPPPEVPDMTPEEHQWLKNIHTVVWGDNNQETVAWRVSRLHNSLLGTLQAGAGDNSYWPKFQAEMGKVTSALTAITARLAALEAKVDRIALPPPAPGDLVPAEEIVATYRRVAGGD